MSLSPFVGRVAGHVVRGVLLAGLVALAAGMGGCWMDEKKPPVLVGTGMDMFAPVKLRVHPLTRVTTDKSSDGKPLVEIHVEMLDQKDAPTRGVGVMEFAINQAGLITGRELALWSESLSTPAENWDHWDAITRTYVFRRPLPAGADPAALMVSATLTMPGGQSITNQWRIVPEKP